ASRKGRRANRRPPPREPMRRNRQKLHHEMRVRAEARKAEVRARQLRERAKHARFATVSVRPVARPSASPEPSPFAQRWSGIEYLMTLAPVDGGTWAKVERACRVLARVLPDRVSSEWLPWLLLLSLPPWQRPPEEFAPPGGSQRRKREAFALHLFATYPVPRF